MKFEVEIHRGTLDGWHSIPARYWVVEDTLRSKARWCVVLQEPGVMGHKKAKATAKTICNALEKIPAAGIFADWLEERGHYEAAKDLRKNF